MVITAYTTDFYIHPRTYEYFLLQSVHIEYFFDTLAFGYKDPTFQ